MGKIKYIVGLDPSGNFHEGKGTTGKCVHVVGGLQMLFTGPIYAKDYETEYEYWNAHIEFLEKCKQDYEDRWVISIEDYLLYGSKANSQIHSKFETVQLIGIIKMWAWNNNIPLYIRAASQVKNRWTNEILEYKGYIRACKSGRGWMTCRESKLSKHSLDAIRHAVHCAQFEVPKEELYGL